MTKPVTFPCHEPQWHHIQALILDLLSALETEGLVDTGQIVLSLQSIADLQGGEWPQQEEEGLQQEGEGSQQDWEGQQHMTEAGWHEEYKSELAMASALELPPQPLLNQGGSDDNIRNKSQKKRRRSKKNNCGIFNGLQYFLDVIASTYEREVFIKTTLPCILRLVLRLEAVIPDDGLNVAEQQQDSQVSLKKDFVASIVACGFLCLFPVTNGSRENTKLNGINFDSFFSFLKGSRSLSQSAKLRCILHYFNRVALADCNMSGEVRYIRQVMKEEDLPSMDTWLDCDKPLCPMYIHSEGRLEDIGPDIIQVDFANRFIGGGVLVGGRVQEEIRFCISPELLASLLFMEVMLPNEAIAIEGFEQFSDYTGYAGTLRFAGDHLGEEMQNGHATSQNVLCAIDATNFGRIGVEKQYNIELLLREVNKALVGFKQPHSGAKPAIGQFGSCDFSLSQSEESEYFTAVEDLVEDATVTKTFEDFTSTLAKTILASAMADVIQQGKGAKEDIEEEDKKDNIDVEDDLGNQAAHDHLQPIGICNQNHSHLNVPMDVQNLWMNQFRRRSSNLSDISSRRSSYSTRQSSDFSTDFEEYYEGFQQKEMKKRHSTIKEETSYSQQPRLTDFASTLISQLMEDSWKVLQQTVTGVQAFGNDQPSTKMVRPLPTRESKLLPLAIISQESSQDLTNSSSATSTTEEDSKEDGKFHEETTHHTNNSNANISASAASEYVNSLVEGAMKILRDSKQPRDDLSHQKFDNSNPGFTERTLSDSQDASRAQIVSKTKLAQNGDRLGRGELDECTGNLALGGLQSSSNTSKMPSHDGEVEEFAQELLKKLFSQDSGCGDGQKPSANGVESLMYVNKCSDDNSRGMVCELVSKTLDEATHAITAVLQGPIASDDNFEDQFGAHGVGVEDQENQCSDCDTQSANGPPLLRDRDSNFASMHNEKVPITHLVEQSNRGHLGIGKRYRSFSMGNESDTCPQEHPSHPCTTHYNNLEQYSNTCAKIVLLDTFSVLRKFYKLHSDWRDKRRGSVPLTRDCKNLGAEILAGEFAKSFHSDDLTRFAEDLIRRSSVSESNRLPRRGSCGFRDATLSDFAEQLMHSNPGSPSFQMFQMVQEGFHGDKRFSTNHRKSFDYGNLRRGSSSGMSCLCEKPEIIRRGSTGGIKMKDIFNVKPYMERLSDYADDVVNEVIHDVFVKLCRSETCTSESEFEDHDCSHEEEYYEMGKYSESNISQGPPTANNVSSANNCNNGENNAMFEGEEGSFQALDNFAQQLSCSMIESAVAEAAYMSVPSNTHPSDSIYQGSSFDPDDNQSGYNDPDYNQSCSYDPDCNQSEEEWADAYPGPDQVQTVAKKIVSAAINDGVEKYVAEKEFQLPVATGNWGCGAFCGDPQLKAMVQWMAASFVDAPHLSYFTFGDERMTEFEAVVQHIQDKGWKVQDVMSALLNYCELAASECEDRHMVTTPFFQYIYML